MKRSVRVDLQEILLYAVAIGAVLSIVAVLFYMWKSGNRKDEKTMAKEDEKEEKNPVFKVKRSVSADEANKARNELKVLNLESEITSYALTRLYEAEAEGKISEEERKRLLESYKRKMEDLERQINNFQLLSGLHELEKAQEELVNTFYGKFGEITKKVDDLRAKLGIASKEEVIKSPKSQEEEKKEEAKPASSKVRHEEAKPKRTDAEERIEKIREEVLKVLERLEQIETEA
jgi:hypothetical protein